MQLKTNVAVALLFAEFSQSERKWDGRIRKKVYFALQQKPIKQAILNCTSHKTLGCLSEDTLKACKICLCVHAVRSKWQVQQSSQSAAILCTPALLPWGIFDNIKEWCGTRSRGSLLTSGWEGRRAKLGRKREMRSRREGSEGGDRSRSNETKMYLLNEGEKQRKTVNLKERQSEGWSAKHQELCHSFSF